MSIKNENLNEKEAAAYINMTTSFLQRDRCHGVTGNRTPGPPFYRIGRRIFYKISDLDTWLEKHRVERPA